MATGRVAGEDEAGEVVVALALFALGFESTFSTSSGLPVSVVSTALSLGFGATVSFSSGWAVPVLPGILGVGRGGKKTLSVPGIFLPTPALLIAGRKVIPRHRKITNALFIMDHLFRKADEHGCALKTSHRRDAEYTEKDN